MKTKNRNFLFSAVLMMGIAMMTTACAVERDNPAATTPVGDKIVGKWYAETPKQVTLGTGEKAVECAKVVLVGSFDADGEGYWSLILVDKQNRAIQPVGKDGKEHPYFANCKYSVTGNAVNVKLTANYLPTSQMEWMLNYNGTCLQTKYEDRIIDLHPITTGEDAMFQEWMRQLGFGASADNYNINDKDITAENWRQLEAIYVYDGVGADVTDEKGRTGYTTVNLPWYNGVVMSNLPMNFCDDITPENGWEWVLNLCGSRSMPNGNFFALYNKYLGILRFFYYMPQDATAGNDHLWQITMTQGLIERYDMRYGIPTDKTVSAKHAFGLMQDGSSWADYTTPYVSTKSDDGFINPNVGWWAFDVDLSLYRPGDIDFKTEKLRLQMRSWNNSHVSLFSTFTAESKGDFIDLTKAAANKSKGLFGKISDVVKTGTSLGKTVISLRKGDVKGGITNGIAFGKNAVALKSTFSGGGGGDPAPTGLISFTTTGKVDTDGVISSSQPTVGVASPTFLLSENFKGDNTIGQGIWNIKSTPKIYATNSANTIHNFIPDDRKIEKYAPYFYDSWLTDAANWMFFDPSSVEVVLNPNIFPEDQIEWMQVDAVAGSRKSLTTDEVDNYRAALGMEALAKKTVVDDQLRWTKDYGSETNDYVFNFAAAENSPEQTLELTYPKSIDNGKTGYKINTLLALDEVYEIDNSIEQELRTFGAGTEDDYIIEPQMTFWRDGMDNMHWGVPRNREILRDKIATYCRADDRNGKPANFDYTYIEHPDFLPPGYTDETSYVVGYDDDGKNGYPKPTTATMDIKYIPAHFPAAEINVTLTIKMKNMAEPIVFNRIYLPEYEYVKVVGDEKASLAILDRILAKKNLSPKTAGHTQSYDFQAARINKCFKYLFGYSR